MNFYTNVVARGDYILFRGVENGQRVTKRISDYQPTLYLPATTPTQFRSIDGRFMEPFCAGGIKDSKDFLKKYEDVDNFEVHGMTDFSMQWISDNYPQEIVEHKMDLIRIFNLDIEVASPNGFPDPDLAEYEILLVTIHDSIKDTYFTFGCGNPTGGDYTPHLPNVRYFKCKNEIDLLVSLIHFWEENYPDIVTGWHVRFFDIAYLIHRIKKLLGDDFTKRLSPWGQINERNITIQGQTKRTYEFLGIAIMDGLELYKKYTYVKQESYKLGYIARVEDLGVQKMTYEEEKSLHDLYLNNYQKYTEYNIRDTEVVNKLLAKHKFIDIVLGIAYIAKVNWSTVYSPVATWDAFIYNYFRGQNIVIPPNDNEMKGGQYEGAYVKEPDPGMYGWCISVDAAALYPSVAIQWNIGPDTLVEGFKLPDEVQRARLEDYLTKKVDLSFAKEANVCFAPNRVVFTKKKVSSFSALFSKLLTGRAKAKKEMLDCQQLQVKDKDNKALSDKIASLHNLQLVMKIFANSGYGAMGNAYFRYFDVRLAEATTIGAQMSTQFGWARVNKVMNQILKTTDKNYIVMSDTDSLYITCDDLVKSAGLMDASKEKIVNFLDKFAKQILQPELDKAFNELFDYVNGYEQKIFMKRESIAERLLVGAKKRYAMSVWDNEGVRYDKPKIKITGYESVRSTTPEYCRKAIKEAMSIILTKTKDELFELVSKCEAEFLQLPPEDTSRPVGINDLRKYKHPTTIYTKGTPIHVKGALIYNHLLKEKGLDKQYELIKDGDKIKFSVLKVPNPIHQEVISFPGHLPKELGLHEYVDIWAQYEKTFLDPIENIVGNIGWSIKHTDSLEGLFQ